MSSPWGVEQELNLLAKNDTLDNYDTTTNETIGHGADQAYEFTIISIATSVLLGVMTLTTIIGRKLSHQSYTFHLQTYHIISTYHLIII